MSSTIITRVINAANDNVLSISNSSWARPISLPTNWSKVRLGIRAHFGPANAVTTPAFAMGLCSGTTALVGDFNTTNFVGLGWPSAAASVSGGIQIKAQTQTMTKVGTTTTLGTNLAQAFIAYGAVTANNLEMHFVDIVKGSPNYTIFQFVNNSNGGTSACTQANFLTQVVTPAPAFGPNMSYTAGVTIAASEAAGAFNAVSMWWGDTSVLYEITDMAVVLLA